MDILTSVKALQLTIGSYVVAGSGPLAVHGIRPAHDIDLVVLPEVYERFKAAGWKEEGEGKRRHVIAGVIEMFDNWHFPGYEPAVADMIAEADIIDGVAVAPLWRVLEWKRHMARPKDITDVALIEEFLAQKAD